jgi:hypothetical protein
VSVAIKGSEIGFLQGLIPSIRLDIHLARLGNVRTEK